MKETNITGEKIITCLRNELENPDYKGFLREVDEENLQKILNKLVNHVIHDDVSNVNALISADDPEVANTYGIILANALEKIISLDICAPITETQLYEWNDILQSNKINAKKAKVLLVTDLKVSDPEILFKTLTEFEKQKFIPAVVLCTTNETIDELKKYDAEDYKLYHYLCGLRKIIVPGIDQDDIADIICDRLEREGYKVTDSFRKKLGVHVEAIYPEAVLSKEPFVEDLIIRIKSVHSEKSIDLWDVYDEEDVPFSEKAEALWEKIRCEKEEVVEEEGTAEDLGSETVVENHIEKAGLTGKKKHPVMLMAMSTFPKGPLEENVFIRPRVDKKSVGDCSHEEKITGCKSQLEPIAKMMLETIGRGSIVDFVIMGTTDTSEIHEVVDGKETKSVSAEAYFIERIVEDYLNKNSECHFTKGKEDTEGSLRTIFYSDNENNIDIRFNIVTIDQGNILKGIGDTVNKIRDIDKNKYEADKDNIAIELWVDTHGGFRDITFIMASLLSILKSEGIEPKYKYGVHYDQNPDNPAHNKNKIVEQPKVFEMFDFVTGMNDFFNYGNASVLKELREKREERKKDRNKEDKKDLSEEQLRDSREEEFLEILDMIAQGTQFCDPYLYRTGVEDLIKYKNENHEDENKEINNELDIFKDSIYSDFGEMLEQSPDSVDLDLAIIERCVEKGLYQQALTFIETLMPIYFFEKKVLYCDNEEIVKIENINRKTGKVDTKAEKIVFDSNLINIPNPNKNEMITTIITEYAKKALNKISWPNRIKNKRIEMFRDMCCDEGTWCRNDDNNEKLKGFEAEHKVGAYGVEGKPNVKIKTDYDVTFKNLIGEIFFIHSVLKGCRNIFNHGKASEMLEKGDKSNPVKNGGRPSIEAIDAVIKKYIANVKRLKRK